MTTTIYSLALTAAERDELRRAWQARHASRQCTAVDVVVYALLRGRNPQAGFSPICNIRKLANGMKAHQSYHTALLAASNMAGHLLSGKLRTLFPGASADRIAALVAGIWQESTARYYGKKEG